MNILVRNLSRTITEKELLQMFLPFGRVVSHNIVMDDLTGRSKGFGFVEMPDAAEAAAAIKALDGKPIRGQKVRVKKTQRPSRPPLQSRPESRSRTENQSRPERARPERSGSGAIKGALRGKSSSSHTNRPPNPRCNSRDRNR
ncbi:MAG: RNA-binding protein [Nitrospirota bacterium]